MMEDLGEGSGVTTGSLAVNGAATAIRLDRLGDYRILREIGRGGMGVVYEAEQERLGRRVALKVLAAGSLTDPRQVRRFEREARAAARLHHTNIVPVFGVGHQDGHHYFVMQFIAGSGLDVVLEDLRRLRQGKARAGPEAGAEPIARSLITGRFAADAPPPDGTETEVHDGAASPPPPAPANGSPADPSSAVLPGASGLSGSSDADRSYYRSVARVGIQVAEAMEYANRQGILHRDVKPSNLLLDSRGNVWVADFGLAKTGEADDLTHTGDILGTIRYMAPERFAGQCDARSDVYSLGLTLYELVALRPAYEASDRHALIERVLHEEPERLRKRAASVPRDLETIISKAMTRDPAGRYATAASMAEDLQSFVEDRPIRARRISTAERAWRWCRRNKRLAASMVATVASLVLALVLALVHSSRQADDNRRIIGLADRLREESGALKVQRANLTTALSESNSRLARLDLERGRAAFDKGQVNVGMLWTVESLRMADRAGDEAGRHVAMANLSAWRRHQVDLKSVFSHDGAVTSAAFSPVGKTILTGCADKTARRWDLATDRPVGPPLVHAGRVLAVAFSPDGRTILTGSTDKTARSWDVATGQPIGPPLLHPSSGLVFRRPTMEVSQVGRTVLTHDGVSTRLWDVPAPLPEEVPRLTAWVEAATGLELDERGSIRVLDRSAWLERRSRMDRLGGPPPPDPVPRLDPILFGVDPSARGDAWKERGEWDRAEAAYAEAIRARPLDGTIRSSLARLQLERGHLDGAAATLAEAVRQMPDDLVLRLGLGEVLLWSGDRAGWRRSNVALVDEFGGTINARSAYRAARACVLGMEGSADPEVPVRLAEFAVRVAETAVRRALNEPARPYYVNILGAALYRAGRYDEAIRRLEEAIGARRGRSGPADWVFLAMAHDRLGHRDEARRWLDRLREYQPSTAAAKFWDELEIRLLRSEAEALILYDPIFPDDPFAH